MLSGTYYAHNYASMHNRQAGLYILQGVASAHAKTQHGVRESQYLSISKIFQYISKYNRILVFANTCAGDGSEELQERHRCVDMNRGIERRP